MIAKKSRTILVAVLLGLSALCISSGIIMPRIFKTKIKEIMQLTIVHKKIEKEKGTEIKLKNMESEVNIPLSLNVSDYLELEVQPKILKNLKLDTSAINVTAPGTYQFTITHDKKIYNGTYIIKEKPLPNIEVMTLKQIKLVKGSQLSTNISDYIVETLPEEAKLAIKLDLTSVNINAAGQYQYTVSYNGKLYTGNVEIYEPQVSLPKPEEKPAEGPTTTP